VLSDLKNLTLQCKRGPLRFWPTCIFDVQHYGNSIGIDWVVIFLGKTLNGTQSPPLSCSTPRFQARASAEKFPGGSNRKNKTEK